MNTNDYLTILYIWGLRYISYDDQITIIIIMFLIKFTGRSPIPYFWESPRISRTNLEAEEKKKTPHHELYYNFTVYPDILFKYFHKIDVGGDPD